MALIGLSLLVASVVYVVIRPPSWLPLPAFLHWRGFGGAITSVAAAATQQQQQQRPHHDDQTTAEDKDDVARDPEVELKMMPPPPPSIQVPSVAEPQDDEQTTPKAPAATPALSVPSFSLSEEPSSPSQAPATSMMPPPPIPVQPAPSFSLTEETPAPTPSAMPPPPAPRRLPQFPSANSIQRASGPVPNRGPPGASGGGGLAPPPTHSSKPSKPSRKVTLTPGHSPLDWARISGPNADLRGVPPSTPYMRVPPSLLKQQNGRKGKDAWMAINTKVYNITPYAKFHPGGIPELLRGAGRDATKLFGEIHPWVNYETMLSACLVGILVDEPEAHSSEMDKMD